MEPRRNLLRRAGLVAVAALLVLGASACSGGSGLAGPSPAATVNGTDISQATLDQMVEGYAALLRDDGKATLEQLSQPGSDGTPGITDDQRAQFQAELATEAASTKRDGYTYPTAGAADMLTELIKREVVTQAVAASGYKITADDRSQALQGVTQRYPTIDKASKLVRDTFVETQAGLIVLQANAPKKYRDALAAASDQYEAQLKAVYDSQPESFGQVCARIINTQDEASATAAKDRIAGGEDFVAVAGEVSIADASAAEVQCYSAADVNNAFGSVAKAGDLLGPAPGQTGFLIVQVDTVETAPFEQVRATIAQNVPDQYTQQAQQALASYLLGRVQESADVTVDPRFGTWNVKELKVDPPVVPTEPGATTTVPAGGTAATIPATGT